MDNELSIYKDIFNLKEIILLESLSYTKEKAYTYIMLLFIASEQNGFLQYNDKIPYSLEDLAKMCRCSIKNIQDLLNHLEEMDLIDKFDDGSIYMKHYSKVF